MIINIPLQINDDLISNAAMADYQKKVEDNITKMVEERIKSACSGYYKSKEDGIANLIDGVIGDCIDKYRDQIIERAATKLAERISRTKAAKELAS